jgi:hypothetical protein
VIHETTLRGGDDDAWGHGWECVCGESEDGFETEDEADEAASEHEEGNP